MIDVINLQKSFGENKVLNGINIKIEKGDIMCVIGPSGSGKSTFLRCLNCMEDPTGGQIIFNGVDIADFKVDINIHRRHMGMVFQHFNLFPHLTILDNITLAPLKRGMMSREEAEQKAHALLRRIGLEDKAQAYPAQLSGGQKQRVAIARALARQADVYVLDEPFSGLDRENILAAAEFINKKTEGKTLVAVSHIAGDAELLHTRVVDISSL